MKTQTRPNYNALYADLIQKKYPTRLKEIEKYLSKEILTALDVIQINDLLFSNKTKTKLKVDQQLRSYQKEEILAILKYQQKNSLNNTQLALRFRLSRNTVSKWKKLYENLI